MSFEQVVYASRTTDFTLSLYEADGTTTLALAAGDVVRVKIGRGTGTGTPTLDLDSVAATANGSRVTVDTLDPAVVTLRLAQADLASLSGAYDVEVAVVDDSETAPADAIKVAEVGVLHVVPSMGGDVGTT